MYFKNFLIHSKKIRMMKKKIIQVDSNINVLVVFSHDCIITYDGLSP